MKAEVKGGKLIITCDIPKDIPTSGTGKSRLVAGSGGFQVTSAKVDGHPVKVSLNAIIPLA